MTPEGRSGYRSEEDLALIVEDLYRRIIGEKPDNDVAAADSTTTQLRDNLGSVPVRQISIPENPEREQIEQRRHDRLSRPGYLGVAFYAGRLGLRKIAEDLVEHIPRNRGYQRDKAVVFGFYMDGVRLTSRAKE